MGKLRFIITVIIFFVLTSCAATQSNITNTTAELETHRKIWQAQNISDYEYTFNKMCFCPPPANVPVKVLVKNNSVNRIFNLETNQPIDNPDLTFYQSIDRLFEFIEEAIQKGADKIDVNYDKNLGYPISISIDYLEMAADDEVSFSATDLVPVTNE